MPVRRKMLMICAHEPTLDPRIRWEAEGAAHRFDVTVLGFNRTDGSCPPIEWRDGYRLVRLTPNQVSAVSYFCSLKNVIPIRLRGPLCALATLLLPMVVVSEIAARLARCTFRSARRRDKRPATATRGSGAARSAAVIDALRSSIAGRLLFTLAVLRTQFATATFLFWRYLRQMGEPPAVVHCNDLDTLLVGVLAKQRYGCRLVFDAHEYYPRSDPDGRWIDIGFFSALERLLIRKADAVVTVNPLLAEAMRDAYGLERVYSVPNAEPWIDRPIRAAPGSEMGRLAAGRVKFLFQGRFSRGRGIDELLEGWAKIDGTRAALFLRGPENIWRERAMALAARFGLLDRSVYFLDAVPESRLVEAAAEADVGIIPYRPTIINDRLSCPNKLSQYLHAGLMVIANDLPYVRSILAEADAGLFYTSANPATLQTAIAKVLNDPDLLRHNKENALRFAREWFNWQVHGEALYALYDMVCAEEMTDCPGLFAQAAQ